MAKVGAKAGSPSRIRFIMFDAEVAEGDIGQITQAIQNALRGPALAPARRLPAPAVMKATEGNGANADEAEAESEQADELVDVTPTTPKTRTPRKAAPKPTVIELDTKSDPPLSSLTDPKSQHKRYLRIAAWLHDHRKIEAITADHVYTCFRHLGWPTDVVDFSQPLRELKHRQFFTTPERGKYAINHLGLQKAAETAD
jgi:hypothetical protein